MKKGVLNSESCSGSQATSLDGFDFRCADVQHLLWLLYVAARDE